MRVFSWFIGIAGLLLGALYGFASSPNYVKILRYSIGCELIAVVALSYCSFKSNGVSRWSAVCCCFFSGLVLLQSAIRIIRILGGR
jgi:hypothetical protein